MGNMGNPHIKEAWLSLITCFDVLTLEAESLQHCTVLSVGFYSN